ncbi:MAG: TIGR03621 family F420-dependent LLM class oxidoreductase [Acidimicrobiales bacterium]
MEITVQAAPTDRGSWLALAAEVERHGFAGLAVADHPGSGPAPFVALSAAAAVTERIRLGTCVVNAGVWEPISLATEVATLDVISGGRALLGVGAGHTPSEWTATGRPYPSAAERVAHMIELVEATTALLSEPVVSRDGAHLTLLDATLGELRPVQDPLPVLVGGNGDRVLTFAAAHADVVGVTGLGRTLADGHRHEVDWSPEALDRIRGLVAAGAAGRDTPPHVEALVQHVEITDDARSAAQRLADRIDGTTAEHVLEAPFVWIGTAEEIAGRLDRHHRDLGIDRYVIREPAMDAARQVMAAALPA